MRWVIDASVVVKWVLPEPDREPHLDRALALLSEIQAGKASPLQPPHWLAEAAAVVTRLRPEVAERAIELLDAMELPVAADATVYLQASRLARQLDRHLFDTLYHAVALEHGGILVSADDTYCRKASRLGGIIALAAWLP